MKIVYDNGVGIVIGGSSALVGSEHEPEGFFAEPLLRLGPGVCDRHLFLVCGAFVRLLSNYMYLRCHTYEKCIPDFGYRFDFLEWNEAHIVVTIRRRFKWTKPSDWNINWQADCKVHWLKKFLYKEMLGFTKNDEFCSGMVNHDRRSSDKTT